jgi:hypothetical protein
LAPGKGKAPISACCGGQKTGDYCRADTGEIYRAAVRIRRRLARRRSSKLALASVPRRLQIVADFAPKPRDSSAAPPESLQIVADFAAIAPTWEQARRLPGTLANPRCGAGWACKEQGKYKRGARRVRTRFAPTLWFQTSKRSARGKCDAIRRHNNKLDDDSCAASSVVHCKSL